MSLDEKPVIGATVVNLKPPTKPALETKSSFDTISPCSTNLAEEPKKEDYDPTSHHPFSAFYSHPTTRTSLEQARSQSKIHLAVYQHDLESGSRITQTETLPEGHLYHHKEDDKVWPCAEQLRKKQEEARLGHHRGCNPFRRLSKKQKIVVHIIIALFLIGAITGLGIGISKAVGGGVFRTTNNSNAPIGNGH